MQGHVTLIVLKYAELFEKNYKTQHYVIMVLIWQLIWL